MDRNERHFLEFYTPRRMKLDKENRNNRLRGGSDAPGERTDAFKEVSTDSGGVVVPPLLPVSTSASTSSSTPAQPPQTPQATSFDGFQSPPGSSKLLRLWKQHQDQQQQQQQPTAPETSSWRSPVPGRLSGKRTPGRLLDSGAKRVLSQQQRRGGGGRLTRGQGTATSLAAATTAIPVTISAPHNVSSAAVASLAERRQRLLGAAEHGRLPLSSSTTPTKADVHTNQSPAGTQSSRGSLQSLWDSLPTPSSLSSTTPSPLRRRREGVVNPVATTLWQQQSREEETTSPASPQANPQHQQPSPPLQQFSADLQVDEHDLTGLVPASEEEDCPTSMSSPTTRRLSRPVPILR